MYPLHPYATYTTTTTFTVTVVLAPLLVSPPLPDDHKDIIWGSLGVEETLNPGQELRSKDGLFRALITWDGNFVEYEIDPTRKGKRGTQIWKAKLKVEEMIPLLPVHSYAPPYAYMWLRTFVFSPLLIFLHFPVSFASQPYAHIDEPTNQYAPNINDGASHAFQLVNQLDKKLVLYHTRTTKEDAALGKEGLKRHLWRANSRGYDRDDNEGYWYGSDDDSGGDEEEEDDDEEDETEDEEEKEKKAGRRKEASRRRKRERRDCSNGAELRGIHWCWGKTQVH